MTAELAIALGLIALLGSSLLGGILWILTGIRDDWRSMGVKLDRLVSRVGEHDSFITAWKMNNGARS